MKKCIIVISILSLFSFSHADWDQEQPTGDIPSARYGHTIVNIDGQLYLFGGVRNDKAVYLNDLYTYTPNENKWTKLDITNPPPSRQGHNAIEYNGKMYILCGKGDTGELDDVWEYDPVSNKWEEISSNSIFPSRTDQGAVNINGKIYVFGGQTNDGSNILFDMWCFDIAAVNWTKVGEYSSMARYGHSMVFLHDIFVVAGRSSTGLLNDTWSYNITLNIWTKADTDQSPAARVDQTTVNTSDSITVIGGTGESGDLKDLWKYNISSQQWTKGNDGPILTKSAGALIESRYSRAQNIFIFGGLQNGNPVQETWKFVEDDQENNDDDGDDGDNEDIFGCSTYSAKKNYSFKDLLPLFCLFLFFCWNNRKKYKQSCYIITICYNM